MEENKDMTYEMENEDDVMMPDGWADGDDYFDSDSWTGAKEEASAATDEAEPAGAEESTTEESETGDAPAIEQTNEDEVNEEVAENKPSEKLKVKYQFDHRDVEEEIDPADLPALLQMARSSERYKARASQMQQLEAANQKASVVAKVLGYASPEEMMNAVMDNARNSEKQALMAKGNSEEIVEDFLARKYAMAPSAPAQVAPPQQQPPAGQMFAQQARELLNEFPSLRGTRLPDEVLSASASGSKTLLTAYREYQEKKAMAERNSLRKENQILKQNAAAAARAPVSGVSKGGSPSTKPEDDFLRGFNSDY